MKITISFEVDDKIVPNGWCKLTAWLNIQDGQVVDSKQACFEHNPLAAFSKTPWSTPPTSTSEKV